MLVISQMVMLIIEKEMPQIIGRLNTISRYDWLFASGRWLSSTEFAAAAAEAVIIIFIIKTLGNS